MTTMTLENDSALKLGGNISIMEALLKAQPKVFLKLGDLIEGTIVAGGEDGIQDPIDKSKVPRTGGGECSGGLLRDVAI